MTQIIPYNGHEIEILTPIDELKRQLLQMELAGRTCYKSQKNELTLKSAIKFVGSAMKAGHYSILEHSCLSVKFFDVTRAFTHAIVRHRHGAFCQQSSYRSLVKNELVFKRPIEIDGKHKINVPGYWPTNTFDKIVEKYEDFIKAAKAHGLNKHQARYLLPIGVCNDIVITANFRQWRHIFNVRLTTRAEAWENHLVLLDLLKILQRDIPLIFDDFTPTGTITVPFGLPLYKNLYWE